MSIDNSEVLRGLDDVQKHGRRTKDLFSSMKGQIGGLGAEIQNSLGDKLIKALSLAGIEQAIQRTGEWASELIKVSQAMGMTTDETQALELAARRTGIAQERILEFYNKINHSAIEAVNGNAKLASSFRQLGIQMTDLKSMPTSQLFTRALAGQSNFGGQEAMYNIMGERKGGLLLQSLGREMGGGSLTEYGQKHSSQIVPAKEVQDVGAAWTQIVQDLKSIGIKLLPIVSILLHVVEGILKMVNGLLGEIVNIGKGAWLGLKSLMPSFLGGGKKADNEFIEWGQQRQTRNKAFARGAGNFATGFVTLGKWQPFRRAQTEAEREAEGAAEGLGTLGTFGTGAISETMGLGAKGIRTVGEIADAQGVRGAAEATAKMTSKDSLFGVQFSDKFKGLSTSRGLYGAGMKRLYTNALKKFGEIDIPMVLNKETGVYEQSPFREAAYNAAKAGRSGFEGNKWGAVLTAGSAADIGKNESERSPFGQFGTSPESVNRSGLGGFGSIGKMFSGGGGNVSIGGVFGVDIQAKIAKLNEQEVSLLQQIVTNTTPEMQEASNLEGDSAYSGF